MVKQPGKRTAMAVVGDNLVGNEPQAVHRRTGQK